MERDFSAMLLETCNSVFLEGWFPVLFTFSNPNSEKAESGIFAVKN